MFIIRLIKRIFQSVCQSLLLVFRRVLRQNDDVPQKLIEYPRPTSVNYHFTRQCNYQCGFCFHTAKSSFVLPLEEAMRGLRLLQQAGQLIIIGSLIGRYPPTFLAFFIIFVLFLMQEWKRLISQVVSPLFIKRAAMLVIWFVIAKSSWACPASV